MQGRELTDKLIEGLAHNEAVDTAVGRFVLHHRALRLAPRADGPVLAGFEDIAARLLAVPKISVRNLGTFTRGKAGVRFTPGKELVERVYQLARG